MSTYETHKQELVQLSTDTLRLLDDAETIPEMTDEGISHWKRSCKTIIEQIPEETMRIAVVGAIKSGKSTLVNAVLGGDYLKRGAGVVTSIVTRIRTGSPLRATLCLKSWEEVNREIDEAMVLFPAHQRFSTDNPFDIRREEDRQELGQALTGLAADQLITNDTRSPGSVLMNSYLTGYDRISDIVASDHGSVTFEMDQFPRHRDFVGDDNLAVYLTDVLLHIDTSGLGRAVEIADCQGADSPNPLHLAMIQDYLTVAHLTVYVVSSRTGLRQADIRFLTMIRKMGILDSVLFAVNCDFSEHDTVEELSAGMKRIEADIRLICPEPVIFTFSALYLLLSQMASDLSQRDQERLSHWNRETQMVDFSNHQWEEFHRYLDGKINRERHALLIKNNLERLEVVAAGFGNWIALNLDLLGQNSGGAKLLVKRIQQQRERLDRLKRTLKNTLDGAVNQIKQELKADTDRFFQGRDDGIVDDVIRFVRGYTVETAKYDGNLDQTGFANILYLVYQDFKQSLDTHMAETVTPRIIQFARAQEKKLMSVLDEIAGPFGTMIDEAMAQYVRDTGDSGLREQGILSPITIGSELGAIRKRAGLSLPPAAATMHYSTQMKTEAIMRLGFFKIFHLVKNAFRKKAEKDNRERTLALASGVKRMKRETERSVLFHLKDYRENIKFQYLLKLADAAADTLYQQMLARFQYHGSDLSRLAKLMEEKSLDKENVLAVLDKMAKALPAISGRIGHLKDQLYAESDLK